MDREKLLKLRKLENKLKNNTNITKKQENGFSNLIYNIQKNINKLWTTPKENLKLKKR